MSYTDDLKKQIRELEERLVTHESEKYVIMDKLYKLKTQLKTENSNPDNRQLLQE